ncbi:MAG TPA: hypothetical protein VFH70_07805 [Acidimicrobiales bacterium]|nr:hypothetical protein [Acidimicrobiales bacterium]
MSYPPFGLATARMVRGLRRRPRREPLSIVRAPAPPPTGAGAAATWADTAWVLGLSSSLRTLAAPLQEALGPRVRVIADLGAADVAILRSVELPLLGHVRTVSPTAAVLVFDAVDRGSGAAIAALEAGADGYVADAGPAELAARAEALIRRGRWSSPAACAGI